MTHGNTEVSSINTKNYYTQMIDNSNIGLWKWNISTGEIDINDNWARIVGYTKQELYPISINTWLELTHLDDLKKFESERESVIKKEKDIYECVCRMKHKEGKWVWIKDSGSVIEWDGEGNPLIMVGTHVDVTEIKKTEEELSLLNIKLKDALTKSENLNTSIKNFYSSISHEIKSPLSTIIGLSYMLKKNGSNGTQSELIIDRIVNNSEYLAKIVDDVVEVSKIESGLLELNLEPISLEDLIYDVKLTYTDRAKQKGIRFFVCRRLQYEGFVISDGRRLRQIIENLLNNALKFTDSGEMTFSIFTSVNNRNLVDVTIRVVDTGSGIDNSKIDKIFEPYFQSDKNKNNKGLGLGLYISKRLAKLMGGEIEVKSEKGVGSRFDYKFTVEKFDVKNIGEREFVESEDNYSSIIFIDLTKDACNNPITEILANAGYDIETSNNLASLYSKQNNDCKSIVVVDYKEIGEEDVFALLRLYSRMGRSKYFIVMCDRVDDDYKHALHETGIDYLILKPLHPNELLNTISKAREARKEIILEKPHNVPVQLLVELGEELENGDIDKLTLISKKIQEKDYNIGRNLFLLLEDYAYDVIRKWILEYV